MPNTRLGHLTADLVFIYTLVPVARATFLKGEPERVAWRFAAVMAAVTAALNALPTPPGAQYITAGILIVSMTMIIAQHIKRTRA